MLDEQIGCCGFTATRCRAVKPNETGKASHRWVVVTDAIMALRCDAASCCVQACGLAQLTI
ncbi:hypothetical protein [Synechococcus phage S-H1]|nr:hypothetical protein [Synechococcus phage S-H1]